MKLKGKVSVVTGGGSGMGRAVALLLAAEGARVMVADLDPRGAEETLRLARVAGHELCFVQTDVSDEAQVERLIAQTVGDMGRLDILINCAGRTAPLGVERCDLLTRADWQATIDANLTGTWLCIKHAAPVMMQQKAGVIVNFASVAGMKVFPGISPYCAAKAGILALTRCAALEYVSYGIRVNAVCPGTIDTPMADKLVANLEAHGVTDARQLLATSASPMHRLGTADEVAQAVLFLASDESSYILGTQIIVDGGALA